jgi:hypothetical protein
MVVFPQIEKLLNNFLVRKTKASKIINYKDATSLRYECFDEWKTRSEMQHKLKY